MKREPEKVQNGLAAAVPVVAALVAIWANLIKGWALVGAVAVSGSVVWLNYLRVSRDGKRTLIAIFIGVLGIGTLGAAAALSARHDASPGNRNPNAFVDWSLAVPGGLRYVDQGILIHQKADSTGWLASWRWPDNGTGNGGFLGLQEGGHRLDGTIGGTAIFSIHKANGARGATSQNCDKLDPQQGDYYSCRLPYTLHIDRLYQLTLRRQKNDGRGQWWEAWVRDQATGRRSFVGAIRVPANDTVIASYFNNTSYFGEGPPPRSVADYIRPTGNHRAVGVFARWTLGHRTRGTVKRVSVGSTEAVQVIMGG